MNLVDLLAERGIRTALVVDDVYDEVPTASDVDPANDAWPNFNDDLTPEQRQLIIDKYPMAAQLHFDQCIIDDKYVATIWQIHNELGDAAASLFERYIADQKADRNYVNIIEKRLKSLGLTVNTAGRNFTAAAQQVDLIIIDLFFDKAQDPSLLDSSKKSLREALQLRIDRPPLVILMSRSPRLEAKRDEFRDDVLLLDSGFRILKKEDLENTNRLELQLERLAENCSDSRVLAKLLYSLEEGVKQGADRTLQLLRRLRLSDIGQIQQLLLNAEGQPVGSYLVDVFDHVLKHEIEREIGIIDAAQALNSFSAAKYPTPYVSGSVDLQELVQRLLTQNEHRLKLSGSVAASVAFGDILRMRPDANAERLKNEILVDLTPENVALVLTPACDIQRGAAPRILLLIGSIKQLGVKDWTYGDDAKTSAIRIDNQLCWIKWNLKHIDTVSLQQLDKAINSQDFYLAGRLREGHALELQQRLLSGLGRVGQMAILPATFPVELDLFYADLDGKLSSLNIEGLTDGAVCFAGREPKGGQSLRLVMTEMIVDGVLSALEKIDENQVSERARQAFKHVKSSLDLQRMMTQGIDLKGVSDKSWKEIDSETGANNSIPKMGLIAWNLAPTEEALPHKVLSKAGIVFLIRDIENQEAPGLGDAIRSGLIAPSPISDTSN